MHSLSSVVLSREAGGSTTVCTHHEISEIAWVESGANKDEQQRENGFTTVNMVRRMLCFAGI